MFDLNTLTVDLDIDINIQAQSMQDDLETGATSWTCRSGEVIPIHDLVPEQLQYLIVQLHNPAYDDIPLVQEWITILQVRNRTISLSDPVY